MSSALQLQHAERPPAQPAYVLRGHQAQIHAVRFVRHNSRLLTGDADGWVVLWNIATKRAAAVWRAHDGAILGFGVWGEDNIVTHGRDFHLRVWQLRPADEETFSTQLPVDDATTERKQPWILHSLTTNTLNFCAFAMCPELPASSSPEASTLIAVPGTKDDQIDIFQLPSERRVSSVPNIGQKTGMVMALSLLHIPQAAAAAAPPSLHCISAYESGTTAVHAFTTTSNAWTRIYTSTPHTQPILSLSPLPAPPTSTTQTLTFFTSGADDLIAKHTVSLPSPSPAPAPPRPTPAQTTRSLLTAALASHPPDQDSHYAFPAPAHTLGPAPRVKATRTKHAGQQSLTLRSDGRVLATAGWDGRVRVYSAKSVKEVAVLAWHREGCYAVGFADVGKAEGGQVGGEAEGLVGENNGEGAGEEGVVAAEAGSAGGKGTTVRTRREDKARAVHWLAAGSKDGKVSLWEVF